MPKAFRCVFAWAQLPDMAVLFSMAHVNGQWDWAQECYHLLR